MKHFYNGVWEDKEPNVPSPEEIEEAEKEYQKRPKPELVTLESLDNRLTDVEYIITGEVATDAQ